VNVSRRNRLGVGTTIGGTHRLNDDPTVHVGIPSAFDIACGRSLGGNIVPALVPRRSELC